MQKTMVIVKNWNQRGTLERGEGSNSTIAYFIPLL